MQSRAWQIKLGNLQVADLISDCWWAKHEYRRWAYWILCGYLHLALGVVKSEMKMKWILQSGERKSCNKWCVDLTLCVSFLAATKQLYDWFSPSVRLSVRPSVCPSHLFHHVPIIVSSQNFQELLPMTKVTSMQRVKVRGQMSRSQRSTPN